MRRTLTSKGKEAIVIDNYIYRKISNIADKYRCTNKICNAYVIVTGEEFVVYNIHNHNQKTSIQSIARNKLITLSKSHLKPVEIVHDLIVSHDLSEQRDLQSVKHMKKIIRNARKNTIDDVVITDFIPEFFRKTSYGDLFLQYSSVNNSILIFYNAKHIEIIRNSKFFVCDGTFKSVPVDFIQLYTFHCEVFGNVFPLIYILLKDKSECLYSESFGVLFERGLIHKTSKFIIDFEFSCISALKKLSKSIYINYCLFHYTQSLWRKLQTLGFTVLYKNDAIFRSLIKLLFSIPFLKHTDFIKTFIIIKEKILNYVKDPNIIIFLNYMERVYIGTANTKPVFDSLKLCVFDRILCNQPLTTNISEGWHRGLNASMCEYHPNIGKFLNHIIKNNCIVEKSVVDHIFNFSNGLNNNSSDIKMNLLRDCIQLYGKIDNLMYLELIIRAYTFSI